MTYHFLNYFLRSNVHFKQRKRIVRSNSFGLDKFFLVNVPRALEQQMVMQWLEEFEGLSGEDASMPGHHI